MRRVALRPILGRIARAHPRAPRLPPLHEAPTPHVEQALEDAKEKNMQDQPDVLFEPVVTALIAMLRHVVPMPSQSVDTARRRANLEFNAGAQAAEQSAKQAAKLEKKAKKAQEATARKERLAAKKGLQEGPQSPTSSGAETGASDRASSPTGVETGSQPAEPMSPVS